jgi:hypothetical protein
MRIAALVLGLWLMVSGVRSADACGYWSMTDTQRGFEIGYLINSASIAKGDKRLAAIYLDLEAKGGMRTVRERKIVFDIKGDKLRKLGKVIGTIDRQKDTVTIKGSTYAIELTDPGTAHDMPTWKLVVKRGDDVVLTSDAASSLCSGMKAPGGMTDEEAKEEVRRRVIFYLAWRETGN